MNKQERASWAETHYEIITGIEYLRDLPESQQPNLIKDTETQLGRGGFWELAFDWTEEFEAKHKDRPWDGEFFDEIDDFINKKIAAY